MTACFISSSKMECVLLRFLFPSTVFWRFLSVIEINSPFILMIFNSLAIYWIIFELYWWIVVTIYNSWWISIDIIFLLFQNLIVMLCLNYIGISSTYITQSLKITIRKKLNLWQNFDWKLRLQDHVYKTRLFQLLPNYITHQLPFTYRCKINKKLSLLIKFTLWSNMESKNALHFFSFFWT
jgi:hypothetical protein